MTVWIYVDTSKDVGDPEHLKVFSDQAATDAWFKANDPEGVAFEYEVAPYRAAAYRLLAAFLILKSSIRLPDPSCATNQRGCLPRPAQVSEGCSGLQYFGGTGGYERRPDTGLGNSLKRSSNRRLSWWILCCNN